MPVKKRNIIPVFFLLQKKRKQNLSAPERFYRAPTCKVLKACGIGETLQV
jgi:hypothetical protein